MLKVNSEGYIKRVENELNELRVKIVALEKFLDTHEDYDKYQEFFLLHIQLDVMRTYADVLNARLKLMNE